jgi:hypothetical protein
MWYVAEVVLAEPKAAGQRMYAGSSNRILVQADGPEMAHARAVAWGQARADHLNECRSFLKQMAVVGVTELTILGEHIEDGMDVGGEVFRRKDVWDQIRVPVKGELNAFRAARLYGGLDDE